MEGKKICIDYKHCEDFDFESVVWCLFKKEYVKCNQVTCDDYQLGIKDVGKAGRKLIKNKRYTFSYNNEDYSDETFSTIKEALEEAKECWFERNDISDSADGYIDIYIGEAEYYTDGLFVDGIIEQQQQDAYSEMGECAEDYLEDITDEEKDILQERLNKVWKEFKKEFNHEARFFKIINEKKYEFNIYSEEFKKYYKEKD